MLEVQHGGVSGLMRMLRDWMSEDCCVGCMVGNKRCEVFFPTCFFDLFMVAMGQTANCPTVIFSFHDPLNRALLRVMHGDEVIT